MYLCMQLQRRSVWIVFVGVCFCAAVIVVRLSGLSEQSREMLLILFELLLFYGCITVPSRSVFWGEADMILENTAVYLFKGFKTTVKIYCIAWQQPEKAQKRGWASMIEDKNQTEAKVAPVKCNYLWIMLLEKRNLGLGWKHFVIMNNISSSQK